MALAPTEGLLLHGSERQDVVPLSGPSASSMAARRPIEVEIMSMQPRARQPNTRPVFLARPKHGLARLDLCLGRPGSTNQTVSGLPAAPVGQHGPTRLKTAGTDRPGNGERGISPSSRWPLGHSSSPLFGCPLCSLSPSRGLASRPRPFRRSSLRLMLTASPSAVVVVSAGSSSPAPFRVAPLSRLRLSIGEISNPNLRSPDSGSPSRVPRHRLQLRAVAWQISPSPALPLQSAIPIRLGR